MLASNLADGVFNDFLSILVGRLVVAFQELFGQFFAGWLDECDDEILHVSKCRFCSM